jgi:hypothetical protein
MMAPETRRLLALPTSHAAPLARRLTPCAALVLALGACQQPGPAGPGAGGAGGPGGAVVHQDVRTALTGGKRATVHARLGVTRLPAHAEHRALALAGIDLLGWLPPDHYRAALNGAAALDWLDADRGALVSSVRPFDAARKVAPALARAAGRAGEPLDVEVVFFTDVREERIAALLTAHGLVGQRLTGYVWRAAVPGATLPLLAEADEVLAIVQCEPTEQLNDDGRVITNTDAVQKIGDGIVVPIGVYLGLTGQGIRIAICDKKAAESHPDFSLPEGKFFRPWGSLPPDSVLGDLSAGDPNFPHPTAMASIAAGDGTQTAASFPAKAEFGLRGHAPRARLGNYPTFGKLTAMHRFAIESDEADVLCHGNTLSGGGSYNVACEVLDRLVSGFEVVDGSPLPIARRCQVWGAGNAGYGNEDLPGFGTLPVGYFSIFAPAKNVITIGSCDARDGRVSVTSSMGPTLDGRVKPDLLAPGSFFRFGNVGIEAAHPSGGYAESSGTSYSVPAAAGILALLMQAVEEAGKDPQALLPSTYKAALVATAIDMLKTSPWSDGEIANQDTQKTLVYPAGPDFATGFGRIDAAAASELIGDFSRWSEGELLGGATRTFCLRVEPGTPTLQVALAWDDREAAFEPDDPLAQRLVNDLDLELVSPNGTPHLPWAPAPPAPNANPLENGIDDLTAWDASVTPRGVDSRNNVELATVDAPAAGTWRVRVRGKTFPFPESQCFSLASTAPLPPLCFDEQKILLCDYVPWVCRVQAVIPLFHVPEQQWVWPPEALLDVQHIAQTGGSQPLAPAAPWAERRLFRLHAYGLPAGVELVLFDDRGDVLARATAKDPGRLSSAPVARAPGTRYLVLLCVDREPLAETLTVRLEYEEL